MNIYLYKTRSYILLLLELFYYDTLRINDVLSSFSLYKLGINISLYVIKLLFSDVHPQKKIKPKEISLRQIVIYSPTCNNLNMQDTFCDTINSPIHEMLQKYLFISRKMLETSKPVQISYHSSLFICLE